VRCAVQPRTRLMVAQYEQTCNFRKCLALTTLLTSTLQLIEFRHVRFPILRRVSRCTVPTLAQSALTQPNSLIQSDLFTFHIGDDKTPFVVHSSAVAATSDPFRALVSGGLGEAQTRTAELDDVQPDDFVRFLEYAYRRDYTVPGWTHDGSAAATSDVEQGEEVVVEEAPPSPLPEVNPDNIVQDVPAVEAAADDGWGSFALTPKKKKVKKSDAVALRNKFQKRNYLTDSVDLEGFQPKSNSAADQNFTPVFLAHARLYTFAEMRLVYPLRSLTLHKLHKTLVGFQLYTERVGDIVELARYAYDHGPDRSKSGRMNDLRQLVVEYMACEVDTIGKHKDFKTLLEEGGEFVTDFWGIVSKYLLKV
jgi:hypothetical protein